MADFLPIFEKVMRLEGGYHLHEVPGDRGGMTYAGIARKFHPDWPGWPRIDSKQYDAKLTQLVRDFYIDKFWNKIQGDEVQSQIVAYHLFEFSVNSGTRNAVRLAQAAINITADGIFGPATLAALNEIDTPQEEEIFVLRFSLLKIFRYKNICLNDKRRRRDRIQSNLKFLCGWINRAEKGLAS